MPLIASGDKPPTMMPPMVTRLIISTEMPFSTATNNATGIMTATISPPAPAAEISAPKIKKMIGSTLALPRARQTMFLDNAWVVPFNVAMPNRNVVDSTIKNTLVGQLEVTILLTLMSVPQAWATSAKMYAATRPITPAFFLVMTLNAITATRTIRDATAIMVLSPSYF